MGLEIQLPYMNAKCAGSEIHVIGENEVYYKVSFDNESAARLLLKNLQERLPKRKGEKDKVDVIGDIAGRIEKMMFESRQAGDTAITKGMDAYKVWSDIMLCNLEMLLLELKSGIVMSVEDLENIK